MPIDANAFEFMAPSSRSVMTTFRRDGGLQMSVVTAVPRPNGTIFVWTRPGTAKFHNLGRNPKAAICAVDDKWSRWMTVEATVEVVEHDHAAELLDEYYRLRERKEPDDDWHKRMAAEGRHMLILTPTRVVQPER